MNYIDCHSHLLPGVDPERREYTERLLRLNAQEIFFS